MLDFYYKEEKTLFRYVKPIDPEEDGLDVPVLQVFSKIVKYPKKPKYVDAHNSKGGLVVSERGYEKIAPFEHLRGATVPGYHCRL
jgi:hypothetical protein